MNYDNVKIERIGLFGGTFAPPHKGHIYAAQTMLKSIRLDKLLIMPAYIPPHKQKKGLDTPEQRFKMCEAAFGSLPKTVISDYEISKGGISYTVETLAHLKNDKNEIFLLCGSDMFMTLESWYCSSDIFKMAKIVAIPRYSDDMTQLSEKKSLYEKKYEAQIYIIDANPFELSSTEIREAVSEGKDLAPYLSDEVIEIIKNQNLYSKQK